MISPATFFAIYFVVWWICLFVVLPFGVRNQVDTGSYIQGTERGAPIHCCRNIGARLQRKKQGAKPCRE